MTWLDYSETRWFFQTRKNIENIEKIRIGSIGLIRNNSIEYDSVRFVSIDEKSFTVNQFLLLKK
jgi:hypothetical protein